MKIVDILNGRAAVIKLMSVSFDDFNKSLRVCELSKKYNEVVDAYIAETDKIKKLYPEGEEANLALTALLNTETDFPKLPVTFDDIKNAKYIENGDYFSARDILALEKFL